MGLKLFQRCDPKLLRRTALGSALPPNMIGHAIPPLEIQSTTLAIALGHTTGRKMWTKFKWLFRWSEPAGCQTEKGLKCQILHDLFLATRGFCMFTVTIMSLPLSTNWTRHRAAAFPEIENWGAEELAALRAYPIFILWNIITQKKVFVIQKKSIFNNDCIKTHCILHSAAKNISPGVQNRKNVIKQKVQH